MNLSKQTPAQTLRDLWESYQRPIPAPPRCGSLDCNHLEAQHTPGQGCDVCPCQAFVFSPPEAA